MQASIHLVGPGMRAGREADGPGHIRRRRRGSNRSGSSRCVRPPHRSPRRRRHVGHPPERERPPQPVEDRTGQPAEDAPIKDVSPLPALKRSLSWWMASGWNEVEPGPRSLRPGRARWPARRRGPGRPSPRRARQTAMASAAKQAHEDHHAVAVDPDVQARKDEQDRPHPCLPWG